jgi:hypothetical protein
MSDLRTSKQQMQDELKAQYDEMTDPAAIARRKQREEREAKIKDKTEDYGL